VPTSIAKPLTEQEKQELEALLFEMTSRGMPIKDELKNLITPEPIKSTTFRRSENGYFIREDGWIYNPGPQAAAFIASPSRFVLAIAGRGCVSGDTKINGVPIAERNSIDLVRTLSGNHLATGGFLKGKDNLFRVTTEFGSSVRVTEHHRFLTPKGWLPLNQLGVGSLVLSDGTLRGVLGTQISSDCAVNYSEGFHQYGELYDLLEQVSLDILRQLHKLDGDSSALYLYDLLSIVDFSSLALFRLCVEYQVGLISFSQLPNLLQTLVQFLYKIYQSRKVLIDCLEETSWFLENVHQIPVVFPASLEHTQQSHQIRHRYSLSAFEIFLSSKETHNLPNQDVYQEFALEKDFLSSCRNALGTEYLTYDRFFSMSLDLDQTLGQFGIHSEFLKLFGQFVSTEDFPSLLEEKQIYQKILQLYIPEQKIYGGTLQSLLHKFLPQLVSVFVRDLSFLGDHSLDLLELVKHNRNSSTQFDKIQGVKFDGFGDYYDLTVPDARHYVADGLFHHNSGKSAAGAQKAMDKISKGLDGAVINPIFSDFKTSTWPEFKRWIDWSMVVPSQRHRKSDAWEPHQPFTMVFTNGAKVYCKGLKDPKSARGANINWLWYDEAASDETGMSWKIAIASVRVGENPQAWATTTPKGKEHWLYKFFIERDIPQEAVELLQKDAKILIEVFKWSIIDNKANLDPAYYASVISAFPSGWLRAQEIDGEFAEEGGKIGDRNWFNGKVRNEAPEIVSKRLRFWDLAATEKKQVKDDPDDTVGTLLSKRFDTEVKKDIFCIEHQVAGKWEWKQLLEAIANTARHDGPEIPVILEEEPGSGGKNQVAAVKEYFKTFPELAFHKVEGQNARKVGDRVMAANHWFGLASAGQMEIVKGNWNEKFLSQLDGFTQIVHDDFVTSVTGAMTKINPFKSWVRQKFMSVGSKQGGKDKAQNK